MLRGVASFAKSIGSKPTPEHNRVRRQVGGFCFHQKTAKRFFVRAWLQMILDGQIYFYL